MLVMTMAVWATACSEVSFTPGGDDLVPFEVPNTEQKETFNFNDDGVKAKVDVLFVVDNSGSMLAEQNKLGSALSSFITSLGQVDWQIGITTTDVSDGAWGLKGDLLAYTGTSTTILNKNVTGFESLFMNTVVRQELIDCKDHPDRPDLYPCPSIDERPLEAMMLAFQKRSTSNRGFFRNGADVAAVILSDEDERSTGVGAVAPGAVVDAFRQVFGTTKTLSTYGIVIQPGDTACYNSQLPSGGSYGASAAALVALTDGETGSICASDYGPTLTSIGNRVKNMVKSVTLRYTPDPATVRIIMTPMDPTITWEVQGNTIRFSKIPAKGTKMDIFYLPSQPI